MEIYVQVGESTSKSNAVTSGQLQGSVLRPVLTLQSVSDSPTTQQPPESFFGQNLKIVESSKRGILGKGNLSALNWTKHVTYCLTQEKAARFPGAQEAFQ